MSNGNINANEIYIIKQGVQVYGDSYYTDKSKARKVVDTLNKPLEGRDVWKYKVAELIKC